MRIKPILIVALVIFIPWLAWMKYIYVSASDAVPINQKWDIGPKDSTLVQEFEITRYFGYDFFIEFGTIHQPISAKEMDQLRAFIGDGSHGLYNLKTNKYMVLNTDEAWQQANALIRAGEAVWKYGKPGIAVPVHLKIEKLNNNDVTSGIITDQKINTEGLAGGGLNGMARIFATVNLKPGKYRLSINTLKDVTLPPNIETFLTVVARPKARELKDSE